MSRKAPRGTDSGFGLSPLECPEPCMSWNAPREKPQHLANLPWAVPVRMCRGMRRGANARTVRDSPLAGVAASVVSLGFSRVTWQARLPREVPRGTDSAPETSPLARLAAKTVPLGRSRATCHLLPATCHQLLAIRWLQSARRRIHQIEMQTSARKTPSCAIVTRVFFRTF